MPEIRQYTNPIEGLQPSDKGPEAAAATGRAIQASYQSLGQTVGGVIAYGGERYQQHVTRQEIAKGAADMATLQDNLTKSWKELANSADPNDTTLRQRFQESLVEPALQHYADSFQTQAGKDWAQQQVGHLRQHMFETTAADEASRAGSAALQNLDVLKNRASNIVLNDPTALDSTLGLIDRSVDALVTANVNLDPAIAGRMQTELKQQLKDDVVKSHVIGRINENPGAAKTDLASGKFADYLDGDTIKSLNNYADSQERAVKEQQRADQAEAIRQQKERDDAVASAITASVIQPDGSLAIPPDFNQNVMKYALLPHAEPGRVEAMINFQRAVTDELEKGVPAVDDPNTYSDFAHRLALDPDDPQFPSQKEIINARAFGHLSDKSYTFFMGALSRDPDVRQAHKDFGSFVAGYKGYITTSSYLKVDAYGDQRWMEFQRDARQYHDWARAKGASEEAIRKDIINSLPRYQYSQKQAIEATSSMATAGLKPLPPVSPAATVQSPSTSVPSPAAVSAARMEELRKMAHGG